MPRSRLDGEASGFEPADELADVLLQPHSPPGLRSHAGEGWNAAAPVIIRGDPSRRYLLPQLW